MRQGTWTAFALLALLGSEGALAQTSFGTGDHVRKVGHWDADADRFRTGAPKGEATACWRITGVTRTTIWTVLVAGRYHPSWSDEVIPVGHRDEWFDSPSYIDANPGSTPLVEIRRTFAVVPSCS